MNEKLCFHPAYNYLSLMRNWDNFCKLINNQPKNFQECLPTAIGHVTIYSGNKCYTKSSFEKSYKISI